MSPVRDESTDMPPVYQIAERDHDDDHGIIAIPSDEQEVDRIEEVAD